MLLLFLLAGLEASPMACTPKPEIRLLATLLANEGPSAAVLEPSDGRSRVVSEGGWFRAYKLGGLTRHGALLFKKGRCHLATRAPRAPRTARTAAPARARITSRPGELQLTRAALEAVLAKPALIAKDIRVRLETTEEGMRLRLKRVRPGSLFHRLGLRRGDRLEGVNGRRFTKLNDALAAVESFLETGKAEVTVTRGGRARLIRGSLLD